MEEATPRLVRGLVRLTAPLAVLAFWSGIGAAAHAYPAGYDWRYQTISVLLYSDRNPHGYLWAWAGVELCGLAGLAWTVDLHRRFTGTVRAPRASLGMLRVGFLCMCCAVLPDQLLPLSKGHELFAILAFLGICIGLVHQGSVARRGTRVLAVLAPVPVVLAALTQAYLALARPNVPWVSPAWRARGIPVYLSFAVWEWVTCVTLSLCLLGLWYSRSDR
ncbi:MAG: hypothetical protein ACREUL_00755 [Steroidobacteraceae bacterium]